LNPLEAALGIAILALMAILDLKPAGVCQFDLLALGEIMLRLDPGEGRVRTAREFRVWEGGGEYNVARGLRRCFGLRTAVCTAFADNDVGRLLEDFILQGGVDTRFIKWAPFDGVGRAVRNGLNFTERGFGVRGAVGIPDRGHSASSQLKPGDFDWDFIFGKLGVRWLHTGGIFAALSNSTADLAMEAVQQARKHGVVVSYDLNYRPSLWKSIGGLPRARAVNRELARSVDVMLGNEEDFTACLGFEVEGADENLSRIEVSAFKKMIERAVLEFPNFKVAATTLRAVRSATRNDWGAICWAGGKFYEAPHRQDLEILDRVGGGDSFASGLIYGFMTSNDPQQAVEYGAAHGALAMTTPGDTSMASLKEVESLVKGGRARVQR
jgi:2-dehydro-3-deoxygluconokinase